MDGIKITIPHFFYLTTRVYSPTGNERKEAPLENPGFESRQFVAYGLWREHRLEFSRDGGKNTRLIVRWAREPTWFEKMAICRCIGGGLFESGTSFARDKNKQFFFLTQGTDVHEVLEELRNSGLAKLIYFRLVS
jgi:hypothetical protein